MKLYIAPGACSLSPHIVMREAGIPVELEKVDLKNGTYSGGSYRKINPKGYVPALETKNGEVLTEGVAICQYLADQKPEAKLIPDAGSLERYRCTEWQVFISTEIHKSFGPIFKGASEAEKANAVEAIGKRFGYVNDQLSNKPFLMGEQYSVADIYFFVMLTWADKMKIDFQALPKLKDFYERVGSRPAVKEALKAEASA